MTAGAITGSKASLLPKIHYFGEVSSTFDVAFHLASEGRFPDWDSVLARSQTAGRGQMRRRWDSPPGNLYASLRLPLTKPFDTSAASTAIGALCANALRSSGCPVQLKWPNDLVVARAGGYAKLGGILLEQRGGVLVAGIGININSAPDLETVHQDFDLPAANLKCENKEIKIQTPSQLWLALIRHFYSVYKSGSFFPKIWKDVAEELLVWRGEAVVVAEGKRDSKGVLKGIGDNGAALVEMDGKLEEVVNGSIWPADAY